MEKTLTLQRHRWTIGETRDYVLVTLPYNEFAQFFSVFAYSAASGKGEQRHTIPGHAKYLAKEMVEGRYSPDAMKAALYAKHRKLLVENIDGTVNLTLNTEEPLPITDGGHRRAAMATILEGLTSMREEGVENAQLETAIANVNETSVSVEVLLDGNPKADFLRFQMGRPVEKSQLFSMSVGQKMHRGEEPAIMRLAWETAKCLDKQEGSPFREKFYFDSRKCMRPLPVTTVCDKSASGLSTSLVGLARVLPHASAEDLSAIVVTAFAAISEKAPTLLEEGTILTPPAVVAATRGSATMLVGVGVVLGYLASLNEDSKPTEDDIKHVVSAAKAALDHKVNGSFTSSQKRALMGDFTREACKRLKGPAHEGVPVALVEKLSSSAFGLSKLSKQKTPPAETTQEAAVVA